MTNCLLQSKGFSFHFWFKAISYVNYIINCIINKDLKNTTPKEAWILVKHDVSHFPLFGSEAWSHILDEKWKYLGPMI